jgi:hypothetical protein
VFGYVYHLRGAAKRMKDKNRYVYYTLKLSLVAGLVYLIFMA